MRLENDEPVYIAKRTAGIHFAGSSGRTFGNLRAIEAATRRALNRRVAELLELAREGNAGLLVASAVASVAASFAAVYLADAEGRIRYHHFGEGGYETSERVIRHLLAVAGAFFYFMVKAMARIQMPTRD